MPITLDKAEKIIHAGRAKAEEMGKRMTFAVVDEAGHVVALHRMDGANWLNVNVVPAAAYTSAAFKRDGAELLRLQEMPFFKASAAMQGGRLLADKGTLVLKDGDKVVGAVSAGGATEDEDLVIATAAAGAYDPG